MGEIVIMKTTKYNSYLILSLLILGRLCLAQDSVRVNTNTEGYKEYILSENKYDKVLKMAIQHDIMKRRIELLNEQVSLLSQKSILADSAQTILSLEAKFWYEKLHQNDKLLEAARVREASIWNSKTLWFTIGALTALIVYITR